MTSSIYGEKEGRQIAFPLFGGTYQIQRAEEYVHNLVAHAGANQPLNRRPCRVGHFLKLVGGNLYMDQPRVH